MTARGFLLSKIVEAFVGFVLSALNSRIWITIGSDSRLVYEYVDDRSDGPNPFFGFRVLIDTHQPLKLLPNFLTH